MKKHTYTLSGLPEEILEIFLGGHQLTQKGANKHRAAMAKAFSNFIKSSEEDSSPLLTDFKKSQLQPHGRSIMPSQLIWATDNYSDLGHGFKDTISETANLKAALEAIVPRKDKALEVQKQRTKEKAEVFTPSWVCNLQNNLADDHSIRAGAFNTTSNGGKTWMPSAESVFQDNSEAIAYIASPRLEITCGEAPYLVSRYDTVSGEDIPVRDSNGRFQRIGILDRKLRIAAETADRDYYSWEFLALESLKSTYGYEWQGDSLLLARLNILNSFLDYRKDFLKTVSKEQRSAIGKKPSKELLKEVAEIICWNIWQMDGLSMVVPGSCSEKCLRCNKGRLKDSIQKHWGHDGILPVIRIKGLVIPFEDLVFYRTAEKQMLKVSEPRVKPEPKRMSLFDFAGFNTLQKGSES